MALWGSSRQPDLQGRIDDIQAGLAALGSILGAGASQAGRGAARGARAAGETVSEAASEASSALTPVVSDLKTQIESLVSLFGALTGRAASKVQHEGRHAYRAVENRVEDNAMLAVVAAAGIGFLLGALVTGGAALARSGSSGEPAQRRPRQPRSSTAQPRPRRRSAAA